MPNNNDPKWDETFYMLVDDVNQRALTLQMMDADESGAFSDAVLATSALPLGEMNLEPLVPLFEVLRATSTSHLGGLRNVRPITKANVDVTYIPFDVEGGADSPAARESSGRGHAHRHARQGGRHQGRTRGGTSDAFARLSMVKAVVGSGTKGARVDKDDSITFNSKTQDKTTDPVFNETFEFVRLGLRARALQMFDRIRGTSPTRWEIARGRWRSTSRRAVVRRPERYQAAVHGTERSSCSPWDGPTGGSPSSGPSR